MNNQSADHQQSAQTARLIRRMKHPFLFRSFLLKKIPSAFFSGVRVREFDPAHCVISVPYKWFSQNPFRSTYFACLGMAAEMSTGALAMAHSYKHDPAISMLVIAMEATFGKKATSRTDFTCPDGEAIRQTIAKAVTTGEGQTFRARSVGTNPAGETIAQFTITWSFKPRSPKTKKN